MRQRAFTAGIFLIAAAIVIGVTQHALAQDEMPPDEEPNMQTLEDKAVMIVLMGAVVGGLVAPIIGYATQQQKDGKNEPFNWRQYTIAVIIVLPSTLALSLGEIQLLTDVTKVGTFAGAVTLFIATFIQAVGIEYAKSRAKRAFKNK